jgi:hypothetical protein
MSALEAFWDTVTGRSLKEAQQRNDVASKELTQTIQRLSREEKALKEIGKLFRDGKPNV